MHVFGEWVETVARKETKSRGEHAKTPHKQNRRLGLKLVLWLCKATGLLTATLCSLKVCSYLKKIMLSKLSFLIPHFPLVLYNKIQNISRQSSPNLITSIVLYFLQSGLITVQNIKGISQINSCKLSVMKGQIKCREKQRCQRLCYHTVIHHFRMLTEDSAKLCSSSAQQCKLSVEI